MIEDSRDLIDGVSCDVTTEAVGRLAPSSNFISLKTLNNGRLKKHVHLTRSALLLVIERGQKVNRWWEMIYGCW